MHVGLNAVKQICDDPQWLHVALRSMVAALAITTWGWGGGLVDEGQHTLHPKTKYWGVLKICIKISEFNHNDFQRVTFYKGFKDKWQYMTSQRVL